MAVLRLVWSLPAERPVVWAGPGTGNGGPGPRAGFVMTWCDLGQGLRPRRQPGSDGLQLEPQCGGPATKRGSCSPGQWPGEYVQGGVLAPGWVPAVTGLRKGEGPVPLQGSESSRVSTASQQPIHRGHLRVRPPLGQEWRGLGLLTCPRASTDLPASVPICEMGSAGEAFLPMGVLGQVPRPSCAHMAEPLRRENEVLPPWGGRGRGHRISSGGRQPSLAPRAVPGLPDPSGPRAGLYGNRRGGRLLQAIRWRLLPWRGHVPHVPRPSERGRGGRSLLPSHTPPCLPPQPHQAQPAGGGRGLSWRGAC